MRYLLARANRPVVIDLARNRTLCAFDFDGTLAPIVDHPDGAWMRSTTARLLSQLAELYPCIVLSGRARPDLAPRLNGIAFRSVIGNHGSEDGRSFTTGHWTALAEWKSTLTPRLADMPGVWIEDKRLSLAVHYRAAPDWKTARQRILEATAGLHGARVFGGKAVINLVPRSARHKGNALVDERDRLGCNRVLYVGDDENDEDAFAIGGGIISTRIGKIRTSHARYYLRTQSEIDLLLELLVERKSAQGMTSKTAAERES